MQLAWSRIWTRIAVSISDDDNHYTTSNSLLDTQQYKVRMKGKVEQSTKMSSALPYTLM